MLYGMRATLEKRTRMQTNKHKTSASQLEARLHTDNRTDNELCASHQVQHHLSLAWVAIVPKKALGLLQEGERRKTLWGVKTAHQLRML